MVVSWLQSSELRNASVGHELIAHDSCPLASQANQHHSRQRYAVLTFEFNLDASRVFARCGICIDGPPGQIDHRGLVNSSSALIQLAEYIMSGRNSHDGDIGISELHLPVDRFRLIEHRFLQLRYAHCLLSRRSMEC